MQQMLLGWYEARTFFSVLLNPQTKRVLLTCKSNSPLTFAHWIKEKLFYIQMEESLTHKPNTPDRFNRWRGLSFKDTILSLYFLCSIVCETLYWFIFIYIFEFCFRNVNTVKAFASSSIPYLYFKSGSLVASCLFFVFVSIVATYVSLTFSFFLNCFD